MYHIDDEIEVHECIVEKVWMLHVVGFVQQSKSDDANKMCVYVRKKKKKGTHHKTTRHKTYKVDVDEENNKAMGIGKFYAFHSYSVRMRAAFLFF